jgi:hypothetical protein
MKEMTIDLKAGIVRVLEPNGETSGTGFVVTDDGLIFHATTEEREARVEPEWWRDPDVEDVAILRLEGPLPEGVTPLLLGSSGGTSGHPFKTFDFPDVGKLHRRVRRADGRPSARSRSTRRWLSPGQGLVLGPFAANRALMV